MSKVYFAKFGNSQVGILGPNSRLSYFRYQERKALKEYLSSKPEFLFYVSVVDLPDKLFPRKLRRRELRLSDLPVRPAYKRGLGVDRLLNVYASTQVSKLKNRVVVDCGTATCVDFVSGTQHLGGWIGVGVGMAAQALHEQTDRLPRIVPKKQKLLLGSSTEESLQLGLQSLLLGFVDQAHQRAKEVFGRQKFEIFLTGGWASLIAKQTSYRYEPLLGLRGLKNLWESQTIEK